MGVKGLLPLLRSIHKPCNIKQFAGQTLGIDAYGWLHRGTIACPIELAQGKLTTKFVDFAMTRVRMLQHFGITPLLVFDGDYLPSKAVTEKERAGRRKDARKAGLDLLAMGRTAQAYQELQKAIDVTPEMARQLMDELDKAKVRFVVAPYEADSQLVYLEKKGTIHGIISEDSDMLVFGAKVLITKLDQFGDCVAVHRKHFTACTEISLVGWTDADFRTMCILSGCDYLAQISSMGLKTAYRLLRKHKTADRVIKALHFDGKLKVPPGYLEAFRDAELTFLYQWVYCPDARGLVHLTDRPESIDLASLPFIGPRTSDELARKVASGRINPHTKNLLLAPPLPPPRYPKTLERALQENSPQLRKHQSIESFFKPKRTPLAELDVNCFTPSPTQQRLLEQQQEEFVTTPVTAVPRAPSLLRAATDSREPQAARRAISDPTPPAAHASTKRQRLCADSAAALAATFGPSKSAGVHSRFFAKPDLTTQSPSVLKVGRRAQGRKSEINVWSDDSIEEAFASIPDLAGAAGAQTTRRGKLNVFREGSVAGADSSGESQFSDATLASAASVALPDFSQDNQAQSVLFKSFGLPSTLAPDLPPSTKTMAASAAAEATALGSANIVPESSPFGPHGDEDAITEEDWLAAAQMPIKPLPIAKELAAIAAIGVHQAECGSEDLFVPQSDHEDDIEEYQEETTADTTRSRFKLDLGSFAFAG